MRCIALLIIINLFVNSISQSVKITDKLTGKAINNVVIFDENHSSVSDNNGMADISMFTKSQSITVQHASYNKKIVSFSSIEKQGFYLKLSPKLNPLEEITVSSNRWAQSSSEVYSGISIINPKIEKLTESSNTADLLSSPEVFIQKSQQGGGSPMIRGFSANRLLIVVDGVRMNNAIYRGGNLHNVISVDAYSLDKLEIIPGPSSVMYGSDAIGGVMNFRTYDSEFHNSSGFKLNVGGYGKMSSAARSSARAFKSVFSTKRFWWGMFYSHSTYGDLRMGRHGNDEYLRPLYVERNNSKDTVIKNSDPNIQRWSGYRQTNFTNKFKFKLDRFKTLSYSFYNSETSNIPRYDRLIQMKGDSPKYAKWEYGPQKWQMHTLKFNDKNENLFYNSSNIIAAFQDYEESRISRKFNDSNAKIRTEYVDVFSVNADFLKKINSSKVLYGLEAVSNRVDSEGEKQHVDTGVSSSAASRYPDGSTYKTMAAYLKYIQPVSNFSNITAGIRYNHVWSKAYFTNEFYNFPFTDIKLSEGNINYSLGYNLSKPNNWNFSALISTGFRAPNIDDLGKVFDSEPGSVVVPNENLKSEYAYNVEFSIKKYVNGSSNIGLTAFYTIVDDVMLRANGKFNGQDSIMYDGVKSQVQMITNKGKAVSYGFTASSNIVINSYLNWNSSFTWQQGEDEDGYSLRHIPPMFGRTEVEYRKKNFSARLFMIANGEISHKNLAPTERSKTHMYAKDSDGKPYSPSWLTLNFNCGYKVTQSVSIQLSIENILDKRYRPYSSGLVAPGRNFIASLKVDL